MTDRSFIDQLADVWAALVDLGRGLTPEEWATPTECPGWSVQDHLSHVVGTEAALLGRPAPPPAPPAEHVANPIGELNEACVVERRPFAGADVVAELEEVGHAARLEGLRAMSDERLETPSPSPIGEVPYARFMAIRVMDCWVHEQDMRQALGRPWRLDSPAAPAAVDRLASSFGYVVGKQVAPPEGSVVEAVVEGPVARILRVAVRDGRAVNDGGRADPDVRIRLSDETYVRLATGRLDPVVALDAGMVGVEGDRATGETVVAHLAQMP